MSSTVKKNGKVGHTKYPSRLTKNRIFSHFTRSGECTLECVSFLWNANEQGWETCSSGNESSADFFGFAFFPTLR